MSKISMLLIAISVFFSFGCKEVNICKNDIDNARWEEKQRWMDYQLHVKNQAVFAIQDKIIRGEITLLQGFIELTKVATDATPFYK